MFRSATRRGRGLTPRVLPTPQVYPSVCHHAFNILNCRALGPSYAVLATDYSAECHTTSWNVHFAVALFTIVVFAFGVPV